MQLEQLRYFLELARVGNVGRAASRLGIGQATLSRSMRILETALNSKLLIRHSRGVTLTPKGSAFFEKAEAALHLLDQAVQPATEFENPGGAVTVGFSSSSALALAAPLAKTVLSKHPCIKLIMIESNDRTIEDLVKSRRADISVMHEPTEIKEFNIVPVVRERLCLVLPPSSSMAHTSAPIHFRDLVGVPLILQSPADRSRRLIMRAEKQQSIRLSPILEVDGINILKAMIYNNIGCGIAIEQNVQDEVRRGTLLVRPIDRPNLNLNLSILTARETHPSLSTATVVRAIQDTVTVMLESKIWAGGEALESMPERSFYA